MAVVDYFLKIEGIAGESTDVQHKGEFEIKDFSFGVENPTTIGSATGGAGAGKIKFNEFTIKKTTDKASPVLMQSCATGQHLKEATFTARKAGEQPVEFLKIRMSDVLVSSYRATGVTPPPPPPSLDVAAISTGGSGSDLTSDAVALSYRAVQLTNAQPTRVAVPPTAVGTLLFDPKTSDVTVGEGNNGIFLVATDGGRISRAVQEFDVAILIGLLTSPFGGGTLHLNVNEVRQPPGPPNDAVNALSVDAGPQPHL